MKINKQVGFWVLMCIVTLVFKLSFHELWKDEWQAWFIVRDQNFSEMIDSLSVEGHPFLYYFYLKLFTFLIPLFDSSQEHLLQISHWLLYVLACYFFLIKIKLPFYLKALVVLGYFMFFEYGIVNRGYMLCILLCFHSCYLIQSQKENKIFLACSLFLLTQTEVFGLMIAGCFCLYMLLRSDKSLVEKIKNHLYYLLALCLGFVMFLWQLLPSFFQKDLPPEISNVQTSGSLLEALQASLSNVFFLGLMQDTAQHGSSALGIAFSLVSLGIVGYLFWNSRAAFVTFLIYIIATFTLYSGFYLGGIRQWGMSLIFFVCLLTLEHENWSKDKLKKYLLILLLAIQLIHNIKAIALDISSPFSHSKNAGHFLAENVPENVPIVAINKMACSPVIGYADRKFYSLPTGEAFSYFDWREKIYFPPESELKLFADYKGVSGLILISPKELDSSRYPKLQRWKSFGSGSLKKENYHIYSFK